MAAPHALHEEFPADAARILALEVSKARLASLLDEHAPVGGEVENAAARIEPTDRLRETALRRQRAQLGAGRA